MQYKALMVNLVHHAIICYLNYHLNNDKNHTDEKIIKTLTMEYLIGLPVSVKEKKLFKMAHFF